MPLKIALIVVAMIALASLELWVFWVFGERQHRRRHDAEPERAESRGEFPALPD